MAEESVKAHNMRIKNDNSGVVVLKGHVQGLGIIRSLGIKGIPIYLLDEEMCIGRFSKYLTKFFKFPKMNDEEKFINFLVEICEKNRLQNWILMPTNDAGVEILSKNKDKLEEYYKIPTPRWEITKFAYDKRLSYKLAENNNIPIPNTIYPKNIEELNEHLPDITYPVIIKPAIIRHFYEKIKKKVFITNSEEELIQSYTKASSIIDPSEIMIQEVIPGGPDHLYSFCSFFKDGEVLGMCIARRDRQRPMDFGKATTFAETVFIPEVKDLGIRFLRAMSYYGLSEIEFKMDSRDGKFKFLEMNARTWKWHTLAIKAGVDLPYMLYRDMTGETVSIINGFKEGVKWVHIHTDLGVMLSEIFTGNLNLREYLKSLKGEKEYAVLSWNDMMPLIGETLLLPYLWKTR